MHRKINRYSCIVRDNNKGIVKEGEGDGKRGVYE